MTTVTISSVSVNPASRCLRDPTLTDMMWFL
jgi:hypothetical protein